MSRATLRVGAKPQVESAYHCPSLMQTKLLGEPVGVGVGDGVGVEEGLGVGEGVGLGLGLDIAMLPDDDMLT